MSSGRVDVHSDKQHPVVLAKPLFDVARVGEADERHARAVARRFDAAARRQFALGNQPAARDAAERAVAIDSSKTDAWLVLAQLAAADGPEALSVVLMRVSPVVQITPEFAPAVADTLSGYVRRPDDPLAAGIVAWIDSLPQLPAGAAAGAPRTADRR